MSNAARCFSLTSNFGETYFRCLDVSFSLHRDEGNVDGRRTCEGERIGEGSLGNFEQYIEKREPQVLKEKEAKDPIFRLEVFLQCEIFLAVFPTV